MRLFSRRIICGGTSRNDMTWLDNVIHSSGLSQEDLEKVLLLVHAVTNIKLSPKTRLEYYNAIADIVHKHKNDVNTIMSDIKNLYAKYQTFSPYGTTSS